MTVTKNFNNLDTDNTLGGNSPSDYRVSSQKAIKTYIDNGRRLIEFKKPTTSFPSWYNLYSDGYVEQGGEITVGATKTGQITFSKEFENNKYMPILTCITYTAGNIDGLCHITELTTTGMKIFDASGRTYRWECKGYVATS